MTIPASKGGADLQHTKAEQGGHTPREPVMFCPTCNLNWWLNAPVKCGSANRFRCIECKAVYSGEMLAAPDMLAALKIAREYVARVDGTMAFTDAANRVTKPDLDLIDRAIAKATGAA